MRLAFWATLDTATSDPSTIIFGASVRAEKAGRETVNSKLVSLEMVFLNVFVVLMSLRGRDNYDVIKRTS